MHDKVKIEDELRVKELLKERGILMKDFAQKLGIARESLTRALQGNPQYSTLKAIADELGLSVRDLFKESSSLQVYGFLKVNDEVVEVRSKDDLLKVLSLLN